MTPTNAGAVFERHFDVMGGRAALARIQSVVLRGKASEGEQPFDFTFSVKPPGLLQLTASNAHGLVVRSGRDSSGRFWRQSPQGVSEEPPKDAGEFMDLAIGFAPPTQLALFDQLTNATCEPAVEQGRPAVAIGGKETSGRFPRLVFDLESGLLSRVGKTVLSDYREIEGVKIPFGARTDGPVRLEVVEAVFNEAIEDGVFEPPGGPTVMPAGLMAQRERTLLSRSGQLEIVRRPAPARFDRGALGELAVWDPKSSAHAQVDLRSRDLTQLDLRDRLTDLLHADFDSRTRWPEELPAGFDRKRILALGQDPGLGVRELHRRGLLGQGIGVGIIDQPLLIDHVEYRDRIRLYEEIHIPDEAPAQMHGPAVASIAVGKTVGVAPASDLYYIAEQHGTFSGGGKFDWDFNWLAQAIERMLDVNASLPAGKKIRVISISVGWSPNQKGYAEATAAVERATREGVFVVSTAIEDTHGLKFHGLGREALSDPNDFASFGPGSWWANIYWSGRHRFGPSERLLVPMDCRGLASPTGEEDYVFYWSAGWSWSVPWIAGLYALVCEARPDITPEEFWAVALKTGRTVRVVHDGDGDGEELDFGTIADPVALIEYLKKGT